MHNIKNLKQKITIIVSVLLFVLLITWIYTSSFLKINTNSTNSSGIQYQITDQSSGEEVFSREAGKFVKAKLKKGSYIVSVSDGDKSYYEFIKVSGFLRTKTVEADPKSESKREFVGNYPDDCTHYTGVVLYSYDCESGSNFKLHSPATDSDPTTTQILNQDAEGLSISGTVIFNGQNWALAHQEPLGDEDTSETLMINIDKPYSSVNATKLIGTSDGIQYKIVPYKGGFVIYSPDLKSVLYYKTPGDEPEQIKFNETKNEKLIPYELISNGDSLSAIYSYEEETKASYTVNDDTTVVGKGETLFQVYKNGSIKEIKLDTGYTSAALCGSEYVCVINGAQMTVYNSEKKKILEMGDVRDISSHGDNLIITKKDEVIDLNMTKLSGKRLYSFGDYVGCGGSESGDNGVVLCVSSPDETKSALKIDPSKDNDDDIDKKILQFQSQPFIDNVSVYKNFIYINPDLGETIYDSRTNNFITDPDIQQKANTDIYSIVEEIGLSKTIYDIIIR